MRGGVRCVRVLGRGGVKCVRVLERGVRGVRG